MSDAPRLLIPALAATNFVVGMGAFLVIGAIEPVAADLNATEAQAGALLTTYALVYAVASPLMVAATGAIGRRKVLAAEYRLSGCNASVGIAPTTFGWHPTPC